MPKVLRAHATTTPLQHSSNSSGRTWTYLLVRGRVVGQRYRDALLTVAFAVVLAYQHYKGAYDAPQYGEYDENHHSHA